MVKRRHDLQERDKLRRKIQSTLQFLDASEMKEPGFLQCFSFAGNVQFSCCSQATLKLGRKSDMAAQLFRSPFPLLQQVTCGKDRNLLDGVKFT